MLLAIAQFTHSIFPGNSKPKQMSFWELKRFVKKDLRCFEQQMNKAQNMSWSHTMSFANSNVSAETLRKTKEWLVSKKYSVDDSNSTIEVTTFVVSNLQNTWQRVDTWSGNT